MNGLITKPLTNARNAVLIVAIFFITAMTKLNKLPELITQLPPRDHRPSRLPKPEDHLIYAKIAGQLPPLEEFELGPDQVFRGTLLHRLVFETKADALRLIDNEATENQFIINATRSIADAAHYAKSYNCELAPVERRIDPVVIIFNIEQLRGHIDEQSRHWHIPKKILPELDIQLAFPGLNPNAKLS